MELRPLTGREDAFLAESAGSDPADAVALLEQLSRHGGSVRGLPVPDVEALLLHLRRSLLGDTVQSVATCPRPGCSARIGIDFRIGDYLSHHLPRPVRSAIPDPDQPGWYLLAGSSVRFRLPNAADQINAAASSEPLASLVRNTIVPPDVSAQILGKVERAMEKLAPVLSSQLEGVCPDCGTKVALEFDVFSFVMTELRRQTAFLFEDVHSIAATYHWSEEEILKLPSVRRVHYASLIQSQSRSVG